MSRRNQEIKIIVHTPEHLPDIFCEENIERFWIEKISDRMRDCHLTDQEWKQLLEILTSHWDF